MKIRSYAESDEPAVVDLWRACELTRLWNNPHGDIERKLKVVQFVENLPVAKRVY